MAAVPACNPVPTQAEINTAEMNYQDYYMSAKRALSLGIPIVNTEVSTDYLVIIRDYRRFKPCTAADGKTTVHYGQVIRAVIELTSYDASAKLSLPSLAAQSTLSGKQQYFYLYRNGWYNPKVDSIIALISGKVFDVENYGLYQGIMPQLIALMSATGTTLSAAPILVVPPDDDPAFVMASARAFALAQAKDGKSCQEASRKFATDPPRATAIVDTYSFLGLTGCTNDRVVEPAKSRAGTLLGGVSVK
jgi:hypothetical protein